MLNREFLARAAMPSDEFIHWVNAERDQLTGFEAKLFEQARAAEVITGGDNAIYEAEELRQLIDIGVMAEDFGLSTKAEFKRAAEIEETAGCVINPYSSLNGIDAIEEARDALRAAANRARSRERQYKLDALAESLEDVLIHLRALEKALTS